jgi:hypothetical protein
LLDNSGGNSFNPSIINDIKSSTAQPYIIFCHQDVILNQGDGFDQLVQALDKLDRLEPKWAVAGNAGVTRHGEFVARITDPNSCYYPKCTKPFPAKVEALEENFLVIRTSANISCDWDMFYFYAHVLCLDAVTKQQSCYVIDFHLSHLSPGKYDYDGNSHFKEAITSFRDKWSPRFVFRLYKPVYARTMCFSRYPVLRQLGTLALGIGFRARESFEYAVTKARVAAKGALEFTGLRRTPGR